jgi:hypothetical protein
VGRAVHTHTHTHTHKNNHIQQYVSDMHGSRDIIAQTAFRIHTEELEEARQQRTRSNLPMMVTAPFSVAFTTSSIRDLVPAAKFSNSNTPTGPFHTMVLALATTLEEPARDLGPQSNPCQPSGIPVSSVASPT